MATITDVIARVRGRLNDNPFEDTHTNALNNSDVTSTVTVADGTKYAVGNVLEWADGSLERGLITVIAGNTLTVRRGHDGTTKATHAANTAVFYKDPVWSGPVIDEAARRIINAELFPWVYSTEDLAAITPVVGTAWYSVPATTIGLVDVSQLYATNRVEKYGRRGGRPVAFERVPTVLIATGKAISFPNGRKNDSAIYVKVAKLVQPADTFDDQLAEVITLGAIARALGDQDLSRHATNRPHTTRASQSVQSAQWWRNEFQKAREQYHAYLELTVPIMGTWSR